MPSKNKKEVRTGKGVYRVEWASKYKTRIRRVDQNFLDKYLLDGKITEDQHTKGIWYLAVAKKSIFETKLVSSTGVQVSGGTKDISNAQANARLLLKKIDDCVLKNANQIVLDVLRNTIIYDQSMRDFFKDRSAAERKNAITHLQNGLDILIQHF